MSPSGNISCQFGEYNTPQRDVYCQTIEPTESVDMSTSGTFKICRGVGCVGNPADNAPTLAYGTSTGAGPFRCLSTASGVICTVRSGKGFEISRSGIVAVLSHSSSALLASGCRWPKAPARTVAVLTTAQVSADVHQNMTFRGGSGPVTGYSCAWDGKKVPKPYPESPGYAPIFWLLLYYSPSEAAAVKLYNEITSPSGFGPGAPVAGIGNSAAFLGGQDIVTAQLVVRTGAYVFMDQLNSNKASATQDAQLATAARQVVKRLA